MVIKPSDVTLILTKFFYRHLLQFVFLARSSGFELRSVAVVACCGVAA